MTLSQFKPKTVVLISLAAASLIMFQNCGGAGSAPDPGASPAVKAANASQPLAVNPVAQEVAFSASVQVVANGGTPPYAYSLADCPSSIDNKTGGFTAQSTAGTCVVIITDAAGGKAYGVISVGASLSGNYDPNPAYPGNTVVLTPSGGVSPYSYALTQGTGQLRDNVYLAPDVAETAVVTVTDSAGTVTTITINILQPAVPTGAIGAVTLAASNQSCPTGYQAQGQTLANPYFDFTHQDQTLCTQIYASGATVISDVTLQSAGGACPAGYNSIGTVSVSGATLCALESPTGTATEFVTKLYIASKCNSGDKLVGDIEKAFIGNGTVLCEIQIAQH